MLNSHWNIIGTDSLSSFLLEIVSAFLFRISLLGQGPQLWTKRFCSPDVAFVKSPASLASYHGFFACRNRDRFFQPTPLFILFVAAISSFGDAWLKNDFVHAVLVKAVLVLAAAQVVGPVLVAVEAARCEVVAPVLVDVPVPAAVT